MSFPPSQQPGQQPPAGWTPPPGGAPGPGQQPFGAPGPGQPAPGQPGFGPQAPGPQAQGPQAQGQLGFGGPTGQLVLELRKPWGSMGMIRAIGRIDGYPATVNWGHNEFTVPAGTRQIDISAQYLWEYGRASESVAVQPGQRVEVHYAPPAFTFLGGRLGPTPQPVRGKTAAITVFVLLGVIVLLCICLPLILGS